MRALSGGVVAGILIAEIFAAGVLGWLYSRGNIVIFEKPADVASIVLTASAVILTAATVIIALVAVWGIHDLRDKAEGAARQEAGAYIKGPEFEAQVYRATQEFIRYDQESGVGSDTETDEMARALGEGDGDDPRNR